jgi:hypothetical protein
MTAQVGGGFIAVGRKRYSTSDARLIAAAYDAAGNLLWVQEYGIPGQASWGGSIEAIAGGYIVAGRYNASPTASEGWLLTLDLAGSLLEEKQIEDFTGQQNTFTEVVPMPDGVRYAAVGFGGDPLAPQGWFWLGGFSCEVAGYDALPDTLSVCNQDSVLLDAGVGYSTYAWSTGETSQTIYVSSSGSYSVAVTDSSGCAATDSVVVTVNPLPAIGLGGDTLGFCGVDSALISAPAGFASYLWSTGATTPDVYVSEDGWYTLTVTDAAGCTARDSVLVSILRGSLQQGDTTICAGESLPLDIGLDVSSEGFKQIPSLIGQSTVNIIKTIDGFYVRNETDVVFFEDLDSPTYSGTGLPVVPTNPEARLLGQTPGGGILAADGWGCVYRYNAGVWNSVGLCGFGTGGQGFAIGASDRIVITKGGFLRDVYYSDNDGLSWVNATNINQDWEYTTVADNGNMFVAGYAGDAFNDPGVLKSTDNGSSWTRIDAVFPLDKGYGIANNGSGLLYLVGDRFSLFKSSDNGSTWSLHSTLPFEGTQLAFRGSIGYARDGLSSLYKTSDGGATWQNITSMISTGAEIYNLKFIDNSIFIVTSNGIFYQDPGVSASFLWSTGDTTATIDVTPSVTTTYYVTISNGIVSCADSVVVTVNPLPSIGLGGDTLGFCGVDSALISAPAGFASYLWSTGATTPDVYVREDGGARFGVGLDPAGLVAAGGHDDLRGGAADVERGWGKCLPLRGSHHGRGGQRVPHGEDRRPVLDAGQPGHGDVRGRQRHSHGAEQQRMECHDGRCLRGVGGQSGQQGHLWAAVQLVRGGRPAEHLSCRVARAHGRGVDGADGPSGG